MHYIVGTQIIFEKMVIKPGATSASMKSQHKPPEFSYNVLYTLNGIRKIDDDIVYTFSDENGNIVKKSFDSIASADACISTARREQIPDYSEVYARNTS